MQIASDLSNFEHPVSEMFHYPANDIESDRYKLTDQQIAFFHENGYLSGIKVLEECQIETLNQELLELWM